MYFQMHFDAGIATFSFPSNLSARDAVDFCAAFEIAKRGMFRRAEKSPVMCRTMVDGDICTLTPTSNQEDV
jgi:hypothetical protein